MPPAFAPEPLIPCDDDDRASFLRADALGDARSSARDGARDESRAPRDVAFGRALVACVALVLIGGVVGVSNAPRDALDLMSSDALKRYGSCHASDGTAVRRRMLSSDDEENEQFAASETPAAIAVSIGAIALGLMTIHLFKNHPRMMTWGMIWAECGICVTVGVILLGNGAVAGGGIFIALAGLWAFWMTRTKDRVELVAKLLAAASTALKDNPHLVTVSTFAGLGLCSSLLVAGACVLFASMNGAVVATGAPDEMIYRDGACYWADDLTNPIRCCTWELDTWVPPFLAFAPLVAAWTALTFAQARNFVIGGTVSKWYFAPVGTTSFVGTTSTFIGHAWRNSFGSLAFGALVLTAVSVMRQINERARRRSEGFMAVLACIVTTIMDCIGEIIEALTTFATIQCAISGEDLCTSGREVTRLLNDNFLSAVRVWWLPEMVLNLAAVFLSLAYSSIVTWMSRLTMSIANVDVSGYGGVVFLSAFISSWIVLSFFFNILLSCVDAVFICYAIDKDRNTLTKPDIVAVYDEVTDKTRVLPVDAVVTQTQRTTQQGTPSQPGRVFTQPGANIVYGRPSDNGNL
uniref:Choline transporter-like protein n=1 Tax=Ostreococcus mediterraneus TaxID=1486918 RepID=A0A7S0WF10_9CHLO